VAKRRRFSAIDIGASAVKAVEIEVDDGGARLTEHVYLPLRRGADEGEIASAVKEAAGKVDRPLYVSIPRSLVTVRKVSDLPRPRDRSNLMSLVEMQVMPEMPFPIQEAVGDIQNVAEVEGRLSLEYVAARRESVERLMSILREAEVEVEAIVPSIFATALLAAGRIEREGIEGVAAVLDVGAGRTDICLMAGGRPAFTRSFPVAGDALTNSIAQALGLSFDEAERRKIEAAYLPSAELSLPGEGGEEEHTPDEERRLMLDAVNRWADRFLLEVERSIEAFVGEMIGEMRSKPGLILLCGGGARLRGLELRMSERLGVRAVRWNPAEEIAGGEALGELGALFGLSLGLAKAAAESAPLANLIPREEKERRERKRRQARIISYAAAAALGITLILGGLTIWNRSVEVRMKRLEAELARMQAVSEKAKSTLLRNLAMVDLMVAPKVTPLDVLRELSILFPDRTRIAFTNFMMDKKGKVTVNVEAASHEDVSRAIQAIESSPLFEEVKQGQLSTVEKNKRPIVQVQITFKISPKAPEILSGSGIPSPAAGGGVAEVGR